MSTAAPALPRTKTVKTITEQQIPVEDKKNQGIEGTWQEFCAELADPDLAAISSVYIYRRDTSGRSSYLVKLSEPIDEDWIGRQLGGGNYSIKLYRKPNISHYEVNVFIDEGRFGPPKSSAAPSAPAPAPAAPQNDALAQALNRQADMIEKLFERVTQSPTARPDPMAEANATVTMADAAKKLVDAAINMQPKAPEAKSPLDSLESVLAIVDRLKPKEVSEDAILSRLEKYKNIFAPAGATSSGGMVEQLGALEKIFGVVDRIRGEGGGEGGGLDWKAMAIKEGLGALPGVMDKLERIFTANARAVEARANAAGALARTRGVAPGPPLPPPSGFTPQAPPSTAVRPHVVPTAPPAAESPAWGGPLNVESASNPSADLDAAAAEQRATAATAVPAEVLTEMQIADRFVKSRIVQLVAENVDPEFLLTVIDGMAPAMTALMAQAPEATVREFLAKDAILSEITRMPHYETYLKKLLTIVREEAEGDETPQTIQ